MSHRLAAGPAHWEESRKGPVEAEDIVALAHSHMEEAWIVQDLQLHLAFVPMDLLEGSMAPGNTATNSV